MTEKQCRREYVNNISNRDEGYTHTRAEHNWHWQKNSAYKSSLDKKDRKVVSEMTKSCGRRHVAEDRTIEGLVHILQMFPACKTV